MDPENARYNGNDLGDVHEERQKPLEVDTPEPKVNRHPHAFGMEASSNRGAAQQSLATIRR